jgi:hypothetical protein
MTNSDTMLLLVIAIGVVMGLVVVPVIEVVQAAQPPGRGCQFTPGGNASQGRCVRP